MYFHKKDEQRARIRELITGIIVHLAIGGLVGFFIACYLCGNWYY